MSSGLETRTVDGLSMEFEAPATTRLTWTGTATEASIVAMREFGAAARAKVGPDAMLDGLVDARNATGFDRGARRQLAKLGREKPWDRMVFIGVRFEVKVLIELALRGLELLAIPIAEIAFVDTIEAAEAWLHPASDAAE